MSIPELSAYLSELAQADEYRIRRVVESAQGAQLTVDGKFYTAFASNDYLGLANDPRLVKAAKRALDRYGVGAAASPMVSGHMTPHYELEHELARFTGLAKAVLFSSGYAANLGILTALAGRGDTIFADKLNHACLNDGAILSRANFKRYAHVDMAKLRALLESSANSKGRKLIVTDAVFSMDGDIAPLPEMLQLAEEFDAFLVVDDAHGFGVLGYRGHGTLAHFNLKSDRIIYMATFGKAAGVYGAVVAGHEDVIEWIMQTARPYIFTTALPPVIAATLLESLDIIENDHERRKQLNMLIDMFGDSLKLKTAKFPYSQTAIQAIILGDNARALKYAEALRDRHMWVPAIRPPTVPVGTARLRVSISAAHTDVDILDLVMALTDIEAEE